VLVSCKVENNFFYNLRRIQSTGKNCLNSDKSAGDVVTLEAEWSAAGDVGDGADESVPDALCERL